MCQKLLNCPCWKTPVPGASSRQPKVNVDRIVLRHRAWTRFRLPNFGCSSIVFILRSGPLRAVLLMVGPLELTRVGLLFIHYWANSWMPLLDSCWMTDLFSKCLPFPVSFLKACVNFQVIWDKVQLSAFIVKTMLYFTWYNCIRDKESYWFYIAFTVQLKIHRFLCRIVGSSPDRVGRKPMRL